MNRKALFSYLSSFGEDVIIVDLMYFGYDLEDLELFDSDRSRTFPVIDIIKDFINEIVKDYLPDIIGNIKNKSNDRTDIILTINKSESSLRFLNQIILEKVLYEVDTENHHVGKSFIKGNDHKIIKKFLDQENIDNFVVFFDGSGGYIHCDSYYLEVPDRSLRHNKWWNRITDEISDLVTNIAFYEFGSRWPDDPGGEGWIEFDEDKYYSELTTFGVDWDKLELNIEI